MGNRFLRCMFFSSRLKDAPKGTSDDKANKIHACYQHLQLSTPIISEACRKFEPHKRQRSLYKTVIKTR